MVIMTEHCFLNCPSKQHQGRPTQMGVGGGWWGGGGGGGGGGGSYRLPLEDQGLPQTFYCMNTQHGNLGERLRRPSLVQRDQVMVWVMGRWECALWEVLVGRREEEEEEEERRASFRLGGGEMCASLI